MAEWHDDRELFALMRKHLYTPVVGDVLDGQGRHHQFLSSGIRPMQPSMVVAGRAMPVLQADVTGRPARPFGRMTEALDDLKADEVYLASGGAMTCANWGEIMTAAAKARGAAGAVIDGYHRDTPRVLEQQWPVFSRGGWAPDSAPRMQVVDFRCAMTIGPVNVEPGDLVFGDVDGVVIVPAEQVEAVITAALEKARGEKIVRREIENGLSATQAFQRYGIL